MSLCEPIIDTYSFFSPTVIHSGPCVALTVLCSGIEFGSLLWLHGNVGNNGTLGVEKLTLSRSEPLRNIYKVGVVKSAFGRIVYALPPAVFKLSWWFLLFFESCCKPFPLALLPRNLQPFKMSSPVLQLRPGHVPIRRAARRQGVSLPRAAAWRAVRRRHPVQVAVWGEGQAVYPWLQKGNVTTQN